VNYALLKQDMEISVDSEGFWRWCIPHRITGFFGLFHHPLF
jgi:hypothetical protein